MRTALFVSLMAAAALARQSDRNEVVRKLESMRITVHFEESPLADAVGYLREVTGLNFVILSRDVDAQAPVTLKVKDLRVKSVLKLLLHPKELTAFYRDGAIVVGPRDGTHERVSLQLYDVRSFQAKLQDFPGPVVELVSASAGAGPMTGITLTLDEAPPIMEEDMILTLVQENTGGRSWDENPNTAIQMVNGRLLVNQTPKVHREISRFLQKLGGVQ